MNVNSGAVRVFRENFSTYVRLCFGNQETATMSLCWYVHGRVFCSCRMGCSHTKDDVALLKDFVPYRIGSLRLRPASLVVWYHRGNGVFTLRRVRITDAGCRHEDRDSRLLLLTCPME